MNERPIAAHPDNVPLANAIAFNPKLNSTANVILILTTLLENTKDTNPDDARLNLAAAIHRDLAQSYDIIKNPPPDNIVETESQVQLIRDPNHKVNMKNALTPLKPIIEELKKIRTDSTRDYQTIKQEFGVTLDFQSMSKIKKQTEDLLRKLRKLQNSEANALADISSISENIMKIINIGKYESGHGVPSPVQMT